MIALWNVFPLTLCTNYYFLSIKCLRIIFYFNNLRVNPQLAEYWQRNPRPDLGGLMEATNTKSRFSNALHYLDKKVIVLR